VWLALWNNLECAAKVISTTDIHPTVLKRVKEEIKILRQLNHDCIVRYLGHQEREDHKELHIYMEFIPDSLYFLFQH